MTNLSSIILFVSEVQEDLQDNTSNNMFLQNLLWGSKQTVYSDQIHTDKYI